MIRFATRTILAMIVVMVALTSTVSGSRASAEPTHDERSIYIGLNTPTGIDYVRGSDRLVITGDSFVQIRDGDGSFVHEVRDLRGAELPTANGRPSGAHGHLAVVYAAGTNELVVLDTSRGSITRRIDPGAQRVSSIAFIDDTIWYAHGPDQNDAGVGVASATTGVATPFVWEDSIYTGSQIAVSPNRTDQVFLTRSQLSPSLLLRFDKGRADPIHSPFRESFDPIAPSLDGSTIWTHNDRVLTEMRTSDLFRTERTIDHGLVRVRRILLVDDAKLVAVGTEAIETYSIADGTLIGRANIFNEIIDATASTDRLFALADRNRLVVTGFDYTPALTEPIVETEVEIGTACPSVTDSIVRLYSAYFLRDPDPSGWAFWVNSFAGGGRDMSSISDYFATSLEFDRRYGALSDPEFVDLVYRNVLNREPEPEGRDFWVDELATGRQTRGRLMVNFSESQEYVQLTGTSVPLAGYFSWYPPGTTFYCATGNHVFELGPGDKYVDFLATSASHTERSYQIRSRFEGVWFDDVSTTLRPGESQLFQGAVVNMDAISVVAPYDVGWVFVRSPVPLPRERSGWPFLALRSTDSTTHQAPAGALLFGS